MIEVRLFATLAHGRPADRGRFELEARPGLTVGQVVEAAGLDPAHVHLVMINGVHGALDSELEDGDRLGLFPPVGGG